MAGRQKVRPVSPEMKAVVPGTLEAVKAFQEWVRQIERERKDVVDHCRAVLDAKNLSREFFVLQLKRLAQRGFDLARHLEDETPFLCFGSDVHRDILPAFREFRRVVDSVGGQAAVIAAVAGTTDKDSAKWRRQMKYFGPYLDHFIAANNCLKDRFKQLGELVAAYTGELETEFKRRRRQATDETAFVAAKTLREQRGMNAAKCNRFLTKHGTTAVQPVEGKVRYRKPNKKALVIHSGDWLKYWQDVERRQSDALDEDAMQEFLANAEAEKAKVKAKRKVGRASSRQVSDIGKIPR